MLGIQNNQNKSSVSQITQKASTRDHKGDGTRIQIANLSAQFKYREGIKGSVRLDSERILMIH